MNWLPVRLDSAALAVRLAALFITLASTEKVVPVGQLSLAHAQNEDVGSTSNAALKIGVGARAAAMGGAFVAVADDVNAIYWNPSGLGRIQRPQLSAMHIEWLADVRYEWIGFAQSLGPWIALGADIALVHTGDIPRTLESSAGGYEPGGTFSYNNLIARIAAGSRTPYKGVRFGLAFQIDQQMVDFGGVALPEKKVRGESVAVGVIYEPPVENLRLGASFHNIGGKMPAFVSESTSLPQLFRLGGAYTVYFQPQVQPEAEGEAPTLEQLSIRDRLILALDFNFASDRSPDLHAGLEYLLRSGLAFRGGYSSSSDFDFLAHLSGGVGYSTDNYQVDYAFAPFGDLGGTHRISFTLNF
jgi:hypothetical protein